MQIDVGERKINKKLTTYKKRERTSIHP